MGVDYVKGSLGIMSGPPAFAARDLFNMSEGKLQPLGSLVCTEDGREFVYCKNGAVELGPGKVVTSPAEVANHTNCAVAAAAAVGAKEVSVTLGATLAAEDAYAGGFLYVNDDAGEGQIYSVNSHAAIASAGTGTIVLNDKIRVALTTSSQVSFIPNKFSGLVVAPATTAVGTPVGVPPVTVTALYYFWAQRRGPCAILQVGTLVAGAKAVVPTGTAGGVGPAGAATSYAVGAVAQVSATTEYALIDLAL